MSKRVKKHCSILNYIRQKDSDLHELLQDLCIGRMLVPRKNTSGLTFLRPDKALLAKITDMAVGDDPEQAVEALQSLVLLDHLPTPGDFADKKDDIPTFLRKKLPVASVSDGKIKLTNGAVIVLDKKFEHRASRNNMSVYVISGELVPTDTEAASFDNATPSNNRKVKGGADYMGGKQALFDRVLKNHCDEKINTNPAMEVLVSLCDFLKRNGHDELLKLVHSQLSWDTLASLAIVLQPYRNTVTPYIPVTVYTAWAAESNNKDPLLTAVYYYKPNPIADYAAHMAECGLSLDGMKSNQNREITVASKPSVMAGIKRIFEHYKTDESLPVARIATLADRNLALAEAELRVFSALLHDNSLACLDVNEAMSLYKSKCTLNMPYIVSQRNQIASSNIGFWYSSAFLILRGCPIYLPGIEGAGLDQIADDSALIQLDKDLKSYVEGMQSAYDDRSDVMKALMSRIAQ